MEYKKQIEIILQELYEPQFPDDFLTEFANKHGLEPNLVLLKLSLDDFESYYEGYIQDKAIMVGQELRSLVLDHFINNNIDADPDYVTLWSDISIKLYVIVDTKSPWGNPFGNEKTKQYSYNFDKWSSQPSESESDTILDGDDIIILNVLNLLTIK